jgi:hypothetical protein
MARQGSLVARWIVEDAEFCGGRGVLWRARCFVEGAVFCGGRGVLWRARCFVEGAGMVRAESVEIGKGGDW